MRAAHAAHAAAAAAALLALAAAPAAALAAASAVNPAAASAAAPDADELHLQYVTALQKGLLGRQWEQPLGPFYIPDGQCSGVLDGVLTCPGRGAPIGVHVAVRDAARFPLVALHDSLQRASVVRAPPCRREATVTVRLDCALDDTAEAATDTALDAAPDAAGGAAPDAATDATPDVL